MKGGLYGPPAGPASSLAMPVGAALAGTAAAVGTVAAVHKNYKRLPQNVRDRCNAAIQEIKEALESQVGGDPDLFIDELLNMDLRSSGLPVFDIITEHLVGNNTDQGGKKLPMILSRHFDTALMEHANKETLEEKKMGLKGILKSMVGKESLFQIKLILMGGLRTTESWIGRSHRKGGQDKDKLEQGEEEVFYSVGEGAEFPAIRVPGGASRLAAMIAEGSLDPDKAEVYQAGMDDWVNVREFLREGPEEG